MYKKILLILFFTLGILFLPEKAFATLYINEFSSNGDSDWVEIYNSDSSSVDLSVYDLKDSSSTNKLDLTGTIDANGFATFDWNDRLNNGGDTIKLVLQSDDSVTNQVVYGVPGDVRAPESGQTAGRNPDGTSNWVIFSAATRNGTNNSASVVLTSTPTPSNTPTPTSSPTSTKTPTPAATSTPTKAPTSLPTKSLVSSPIVTTNNTPTPTTDPDSDLKLADNNNTEFFGDKSESEEVDDDEGEVLGISTSRTPLLFIALGLIFLAVCGILVYLQFGDKILLRLRRKSE